MGHWKRMSLGANQAIKHLEDRATKNMLHLRAIFCRNGGPSTMLGSSNAHWSIRAKENNYQ